MKPIPILFFFAILVAAAAAYYAMFVRGTVPVSETAASSSLIYRASNGYDAAASTTAATTTLKKPAAAASVAARPAEKQMVAQNSSSVTQKTSQTPPPAPVPTPEPQASAATTTAPRAGGPVCDESLIGADGYDAHHMISLGACKRLNELYALGQAAGNSGDLYDNRDGLHVNLCVDWAPNPECPKGHRLFPQHDWLLSGAVGRATSPQSKPTVGQASWSGAVEGTNKRSIPYDMYRSQQGAGTLYDLYVHNNLYIYPSLYDDSFQGSPYDASVLADPSTVDPVTMNVANTPYVIASKQVCDCGAGSLRVHDASGSDLPFVELAFAGLAAFRPEVKSALIAKGELMPTLQAMIRYSHRTVSSGESYLSSAAHGAASMAHYLDHGSIRPAYDSKKLVDSVNSLSISDVPPVPAIRATHETFLANEKLFDTPGAIARTAPKGESRSITVSAAGSTAVDGSSDFTYEWRILSGDSAHVSVSVDPQDPAKATVTFGPSDGVIRFDVGVFVRKNGGLYYSVPGIISEYVHS